MHSKSIVAPLSLLALAIIALCVPAQAQEPAQAPATAAAPAPAATVTRVACVGDSITAGAGTAHPATDSYPAQLGRMLDASAWEVKNFGVSGSTLLKQGDKPYWNQPAFEKALAYKPNVVIIMLGTNDTKSQNWQFHDRFADDYKELIGKFADLPTRPRIYVCQPIPVVGAGRYGINEEGIQMERPILDSVIRDEKVSEIDMHSVLAGKGDLTPDTVHPNNEGAALLARAAYKALTGQDYVEPAPAVPAKESAP